MTSRDTCTIKNRELYDKFYDGLTYLNLRMPTVVRFLHDCGVEVI